MLVMFSTFWTMLTRFISAADEAAAVLEDMAQTAHMHSSALKLRTEAELGAELEALRIQLALPAPKAE